MYEASDLARSDGWPFVLRVAGLLSISDAPYLVGGWIRDGLLGRASKDIDFAVAGDGIETAARVARVLGGTCVALDTGNGIGRVVLAGGQSHQGPRTLDFASYRGAIQEDLSRRDFTIDAMAVQLHGIRPVEDVHLLDPFGGLEDLKRKVIRVTTDSALRNDPARLLRAVRLAAHLRFSIEAGTETQVRANARLISTVSGERVREELVSLLCLPGSGHFLSYMDKLGLLTSVFPEMETTRGVTQPKEHHWDVLTHSLKTAHALDFLLRQGDWPYAKVSADELWSAEIEKYFESMVGSGSNRAALFRLAALLHDVSKPETRTIEATGRIRFLGHGEEGAELTGGILGRLRFSNREMRLAVTAVKYHLRPTQMGWPQLPTRRAIYRFCRDADEAAVGIVFLSLADHMAARGPLLMLDQWRLHVQISKLLLSHREDQPAGLSPLIDG